MPVDIHLQVGSKRPAAHLRARIARSAATQLYSRHSIGHSITHTKPRIAAFAISPKLAADEQFLSAAATTSSHVLDRLDSLG